MSDDRSQTLAGGKTLRRLRWSTPLGRYRSFGAVQLPSEGQARWHDTDGEYPYIELTIEDVQYQPPTAVTPGAVNRRYVRAMKASGMTSTIRLAW